MKTASGPTAVQIVWSYRRGSRNTEHIGSAHDDAELEALKTAARRRLAADQLDSAATWADPAARARAHHRAREQAGLAAGPGG